MIRTANAKTCMDGIVLLTNSGQQIAKIVDLKKVAKIVLPKIDQEIRGVW